jgi:hypothetical protein
MPRSASDIGAEYFEMVEQRYEVGPLLIEESSTKPFHGRLQGLKRQLSPRFSATGAALKW